MVLAIQVRVGYSFIWVPIPNTAIGIGSPRAKTLVYNEDMHCKCKLVNFLIKRNKCICHCASISTGMYTCGRVRMLCIKFEILKQTLGLITYLGLFVFSFYVTLVHFFTTFCCLFDFEYSITIFKLQVKAVWRSKM